MFEAASKCVGRFPAAKSERVESEVVREWGESQRSVMLPVGHQLAGIVLCSPGCSLQYVQESDDWCLRRPLLMLPDWSLGKGLTVVLAHGQTGVAADGDVACRTFNVFVGLAFHDDDFLEYVFS